jgi:hypothetical protein
MKKTGVIVFLIGLAFTIFTIVGLLVKERVTNPSQIEAAQLKIHHHIWEPMLGAILVIIGVGIYKVGKKGETNLV